jgi:hypothetical protein
VCRLFGLREAHVLCQVIDARGHGQMQIAPHIPIAR